MHLQIEDEKARLKSKLAEAGDNSNLVVVEVSYCVRRHHCLIRVTQAAHTAAFGNSGLGRTLVPSAKKVDGLSGGALAQFAVQVLCATVVL